MDDAVFVCGAVKIYDEQSGLDRYVALKSLPYLIRGRGNITRYTKVMDASIAPPCPVCGQPCVIKAVKKEGGRMPAGSWFWSCKDMEHKSFKPISDSDKYEMQSAGATASNEQSGYGGSGGGYKPQSSGQYGYPPGKRPQFLAPPQQQQQQKPMGPFTPPPGPTRVMFDALVKRVEHLEGRIHFFESQAVGADAHAEEESQAHPDE